MKKLCMFLAILFGFGIATVMAQSIKVTGKVVSSEDGKALADVTVRLKGAIAATTTTADGTYTIEVDPQSTNTLIFNHPDHDEIELFLNGKNTLDVEMVSNIRYNQYGVKVNRNPLFAEERNGILVLESTKQDYRVWFDVRVQADGAMFFGEPMNPIGNGTSIRRARFAVKTEFATNWYAEFDLDIANSELELKDAYLAYNFNEGLQVKVGHYKEGFSMERTTTSRYLTFIERANVVNALAPSRQVGLSANYQYNWLNLNGGVYFQTVGDPEERLFSKDNNKDFGTDEGVSWTGKVVGMPFYKDYTKGIHLGVAASYRTPKTDAESPGTLRYSTRSLSSINRKKYIDTDLIPHVDHTILTNFELAAYYRNFRIQGEYMMSDVKQKDNLGTHHFDGFYAFGSWLIFGGQYQYDTRDAEFTQVARGKSWGDVELALRYDYLSLNSGFDKIMGGAGEGITVALNYYVNNNVKIMLNYAYLKHDRYASGKGKLFVGHDANGDLTRDPAAVVDAEGKAGEKYNMIAIRFEVAF
ncbi:MAG: porin [Bacteroidales bacterium]|jgi:phosphate-selective porin OprO/OprP|nr:porin [Bacteroidales bacterium]HOI31820.1 porin [Bacteroidales bacterium]